MEGEEGDVGGGTGQNAAPELGLIAALTPPLENPPIPPVEAAPYDMRALKTELRFGPRARPLPVEAQLPPFSTRTPTGFFTAEQAFARGEFDLAHDLATAEVRESALRSLLAFGDGPSAQGIPGRAAVDAQGRLAFNDFGPGSTSGPGQGGAAASTGSTGVSAGDTGQAP